MANTKFANDATIKFVWSGNDQYIGWCPNESEVSAKEILQNDGDYFFGETELHVCPECGKYFSMCDYDLDVCPECVHNQVTQDEIDEDITSEDPEYDPYENFRGITHKTINAKELALSLLNAQNP